MPQVVQTLKSLSSVALLAVSQLCTMRSNCGGGALAWYLLEPGRLDHAAAQRRRCLLVLAGEIVFADHLAEVLEHRERLARRMQCLALVPGQQFRSPDRIHALRLVVLGDRRKAHDL